MYIYIVSCVRPSFMVTVSLIPAAGGKIVPHRAIALDFQALLAWREAARVRVTGIIILHSPMRAASRPALYLKECGRRLFPRG